MPNPSATRSVVIIIAALTAAGLVLFAAGAVFVVFIMREASR